jgi:hypothetical protein
VGQRFELRLPFGCYGPAPESAAAPMRWAYDPKAEVLRLSATSEDWTGKPWAQGLSRGAEAIEGFWVERPWMTEETCPKALSRDQPILVAPPRQVLGLAQLFDTDGSRLNRREGKPYRTAIKLAPASFTAAGGFRLLVQGRIGTAPDGAPVQCWSENENYRPVCLIVVAIDLVAMETAQGERIAEWPS